MDRQDTSLTWVVVDGQPRHVSDFAHLSPRQRPAATCPACERHLTMKLGAVRRHHAAHDEGVACAATNPETALHLDTKLALAAALRAAMLAEAQLVIRQVCPDCSQHYEVTWASDWDDVRVEF